MTFNNRDNASLALPFAPLYPDVIRAITSGSRLNLDALHVAAGIFPRSAYLNQPVEIVLILQNMTDQPIDVKIAIQTPARDVNGDPVSIHAPKRGVSLALAAGEVGIQRLPIVAQPPTRATTDLPVRVAIRYREGRNGRQVRPPIGGALPAVLNLSPYKLQALREVDFSDHRWEESQENITLYFNIESRVLGQPPANLRPLYEALWTAAQLPADRARLQETLPKARVVASELTRGELYPVMLKLVGEIFPARGLALLQGEVKAIAKMLSYTLDEVVAVDEHFKIDDARWFQTLTHALAYDEAIARLDPTVIAGRYLFEAALYDAVLLAFSIIRPRVRVNLGDRTERLVYADKVIDWLAGMEEGEISFIYLPLVLGGVAVNQLVVARGEDPWEMIGDLHDAYRQRVRVASGEVLVILDMLDTLLNRAEDDLRRARILPQS